MSTQIRASLHLHSDLSDGRMTPEDVASRVAQAGAQFASLTDHDTLAGLERFRAACARLGVATIPGLELSADGPTGEVHLLGYGFDPAASSLKTVLGSRASSAAVSGDIRDLVSGNVSRPTTEEAIRAIHAAGGKVFLAHPLEAAAELARLKVLVLALKEQGLDGLEAWYALYSDAQRQSLLELADACQLLASSGCDFHDPECPPVATPVMEVPLDRWQPFREAIAPSAEHPPVPSAAPVVSRGATRLNWANLFVRIIFPTLMVIALFVGPTFFVVVPAFEEALLARKREMIQELTNSAWSILVEYHRDELAGVLSREEAQAAAIARIKDLRYGKEGKDYFWVTDMVPRMVVHPWRPDLNGKDVSDFRDPRGIRVFVAFVEVVRAKKEGYVEYTWQWKDDPRRLAPKQSYVKGFGPWGWVIGTGIYIEDVRAEISALTSRIIRISIGLAGTVGALLLFVAQQSLRLERRRQQAEDALHASHERYRALVEASQEGTLLVQGGRCSFANQTMLGLLGYTAPQLELLHVDELVLVPTGARPLSAQLAEGVLPPPMEVQLRRKEGGGVDVLLTLERIQVGEQQAFILIARDLRAQKGLLASVDEYQPGFEKLLEDLDVAVIRIALDRRLSVLGMNQVGEALLGGASSREVGSLGDVVASAGELAALRSALLAGEAVHRRVLQISGVKGYSSLQLSAHPTGEAGEEPTGAVLIAHDVGARLRELAERDELIVGLQAPLLFLSQPVERFMRPPPRCELKASVGEAASLMSLEGMSLVLVTTSDGVPLGVITDTDLRERVVGRRLAPGTPVVDVMTAPLEAVPPSTLGYEALQRMKDRGIQHLVVRDDAGAVLGVVRQGELLTVEQYPLAVLSRAVGTAGRPAELQVLRRRLPSMVRALVHSGARSRVIGRAISSLSDGLTRHLISQAEARLGPPPCPYAFLALGSEGREEQTLATDQDNAIIFQPDTGSDERQVQAYFVSLGELVSSWLAEAGFALCKGGVMARNPRWVQSLGRWKEYFSSWTRVAEPQNLLEFNIFFDLRCIGGEAGLVVSLRNHLEAALQETPGFFLHLAQNAMQLRSHRGLFGQIVTGTESGSPGSFNVKEALAPLVAIGRLYALKRGLRETNTLDRFRKLLEGQVFSRGTYQEVVESFAFLMMLRLRVQADAVAGGLEPGNLVSVRSLSRLEEVTLKEALTQVASLQKKVSFDFFGGTA